MTSLFQNPLTRELRRIWKNYRLLSKSEGLILGQGAVVSGTELGRYNMICKNSSITDSQFGDFSYLAVDTRVTRCNIGKFCAIGPSVTINLGIHPSKDFVSSHPIFYSLGFNCKTRFAEEQGFEELGTVSIGHDVWVGANVVILPNVSIGTGAIIAAGAVVTRDVMPYEIVGGVPARPMRKRFDEEQIELLLESKWWDFSFSELQENHEAFHSFKEFDRFMSQRNGQ